MIIIGVIVAVLLIVGANRTTNNSSWPWGELQDWWRDRNRKD